MTRRQSQVLRFIKLFIANYDFSPSIKEIAAHQGICTGSVVKVLRCLCDLNEIEMEPGKQRSIKIAVQRQPAPVPDGWRLIPARVTPVMRQAFCATRKGINWTPEDGLVQMLAVAPANADELDQQQRF